MTSRWHTVQGTLALLLAVGLTACEPPGPPGWKEALEEGRVVRLGQDAPVPEPVVENDGGLEVAEPSPADVDELGGLVPPRPKGIDGAPPADTLPDTGSANGGPPPATQEALPPSELIGLIRRIAKDATRRLDSLKGYRQTVLLSETGRTDEEVVVVGQPEARRAKLFWSQGPRTGRVVVVDGDDPPELMLGVAERARFDGRLLLTSDQPPIRLDRSEVRALTLDAWVDTLQRLSDGTPTGFAFLGAGEEPFGVVYRVRQLVVVGTVPPEIGGLPPGGSRDWSIERKSKLPIAVAVRDAQGNVVSTWRVTQRDLEVEPRPELFQLSLPDSER